ncbi:Acidic mammalian chitinase [Trichostrongylus colubriformis]|uniref:Acidic mammalian chitinase n=1 Tax=Trichostrongylus colubriformis TaxID=6319 RepID=A0AAN8FPX3_TRICO
MILNGVVFAAIAIATCSSHGGVRNHSTEIIHRDGSTNSRAPVKNDYIRACYFTNWAQYRNGRGKYLPEDYITGLCTHILFAFGWMNEDYTVRAFDPADLPNDWAGEGMYRRVNALKRKDPNLKTLLSIGGWSFGTRLFKDMSETPLRRKVFIKSAIAFARQWDFDGIDIDWEYPSGPADVRNYASFITELREGCAAEATTSQKPRLLVTAAVSAGESTIDAGYDVPAIADHLDFILLMNYDFHGAWSTETGFNSPLYPREDMRESEKVWNIDWAANHWNEKGMPKEKIIIGIPTYGRGWTLKDKNNITVGTEGSPAKITPYTQEAGVASFYEFCEMLATGATRYWSAEQQVPYLVQGDQWWSYDDEESVANKMAWIKRNKYGGAFVWTLDFDDFNAKCSNSDGQLYPLISIIAKELGGVTIPKKNAPSPGRTTTTTTARPSTAQPTVSPTAAPTTASTNFCDEMPDGFHASDRDCSRFILCLQGTGYTMTCPAGLQFSPSKGYCVQIGDSSCSQSTTVTAVSPTTTKTPGNEFKCGADGFYADFDNCQKFIRCVNGNPYGFDCPKGLSFHVDSLMCDHPDPSKCAGFN